MDKQDPTRRRAMKSILLGAAAGAAVGTEPAAQAQPRPTAPTQPANTSGAAGHTFEWAKGIEGQRKPDLGNGSFLNPIVSGDHPDPSILRDGDDYYLTFSTFDAYPGIVIWTSRDLVNWTPVTAALKKPIGSVWAPELTKHKGRYYVYIPARTPTYRSNYVIYADKITGPWSDPIDLKLPNHIDPGHVVGEDGKRYLFLSGGDRVRLTDDGLATAGPVEHVYDPWHYPEEWDVEGFAPEGPKVMRHGDWFYLITAVGGTAGPPTGHMVIAARSRSINGPWENCPANPLVRTQSAAEKWWSRGHATVFAGPRDTWWMIYHGYENSFWTLGRQTLLQPIEWTPDGWFRVVGGDLSQPIPKPLELAGRKHGQALSDDFSTNKFGTQWNFYDPSDAEMERVKITNNMLILRAKGDSPRDSSPISFIAGDLAYEMEADLEIEDGTRAGVLLFYSRRLYCGLGFDKSNFVMHRYGLERTGPKPIEVKHHLKLRIRNNRHVVSLHYSTDGRTWIKYPTQFEVSGYHHNVAGDFLSLRPAIYAAGSGEVRIHNVKYTAL